MIRYFTLAILGVALTGCASRPETLVKAPMPGMVGQPRYSTDDNSTTERVTFRTHIPEPLVRNAFDQYCEGRRMKLDSRAGTSGIQWWKSDQDYLGILVSPEADKQTLFVTYFYNH